MICMRMDNSFGVIIILFYENILQKHVQLGHCRHLDRVHA